MIVASSKAQPQKEKTKKISLVHINKTFKRKKGTNLNDGKLGLKASFEKEKPKVYIQPDIAAYACFRYRLFQVYDCLNNNSS